MTLDTTHLLSVVVADDHPLFRDGLVRALEATGAFAAVEQAADGETALALIRRYEPDVALLDLRMARMDGIDVIAALARFGPPVPVVLLSAFGDEQIAGAAVEAGATACLSKSADRETICREVAAAAAAGAARSPTALHGAADVSLDRTCRWAPRLTADEHALLQTALEGWDKPALASLTGTDETTLRRRLDQVLAKLGADDLPGALGTAVALGIIR